MNTTERSGSGPRNRGVRTRLALLLASLGVVSSPTVVRPEPSSQGVRAGDSGKKQASVESKPAPKDREQKAAPVGLQETAGVSLTLLDVEVVDKQGRPVRGLTKDDFHVSLNGLDYPIYSVDDLCACGTGAGSPGIADAGRTIAGSRTAPAGSGAAPAATHPGPDVTRYVLYFDFGQLQPDGRSRAIKEAKRWLREVKQADDEVMISAFSWDAGLRELTSFTQDTGALVAAVEKADKDPTLQDPFPQTIKVRVDECGDSIKRCSEQKGGCLVLPTPTCFNLAREEYWHDQASLRGLKAFLTRLGEISGRKSLLYFNENGTLNPECLYPPRTHSDPMETSGKVGDLQRELDGLGSEAALARTAIYAAYVGDALNPEYPVLAEGALAVNSNLADLSGGKYNRDLGDLSSMAASARSDCQCIYRVGLEPPESAKRKGKIFSASVEVRGKRVPRSYRVQFLDDMDRWVRMAAGVLRNPGKATDLDVGTAVVPVRRVKGRWDVAVEVAVGLDALDLVRSANGEQGGWEAGALLSEEGGENRWEMLGVSSVHRTGGGKSGRSVVHRTTLNDLRSGRYRLAAFVRDRTATVFGGAEALLELPRAGADGIAGPVVMRSGQAYFSAPLPFLHKGASPGAVSASVETGPVPAAHRPPSPGEPVEIMSWVCPAGKSPAPPRLVRFLTRGDVPVYKLEAPVLETVGECYLLDDTIATAALAPGEYSYHLRWQKGAGKKPTVSEATFTIAAR